MKLMKMSAKFQITIPKEIRDKLSIKAGAILELYVRDGSIYMRHPRSIKGLRGIAKGMQWKDAYRERSDRYQYDQ